MFIVNVNYKFKSQYKVWEKTNGRVSCVIFYNKMDDLIKHVLHFVVFLIRDDV